MDFMEAYITDGADKLKKLADSDAKVNVISFSYQINIGFFSGKPISLHTFLDGQKSKPTNYWGLQFDQIFQLTVRKDSFTIDPEKPEPSAVVGLVQLVHKKLERVEFVDEHHLDLIFNNGSRLTLDPSRANQTWSLS